MVFQTYRPQSISLNDIEVWLLLPLQGKMPQVDGIPLSFLRPHLKGVITGLIDIEDPQ